jgi:hypothetical protein
MNQGALGQKQLVEASSIAYLLPKILPKVFAFVFLSVLCASAVKWF